MSMFGGHLQHEVARAVSDDGDEPSSEGSDDALALFTIRNGFPGNRVDDLFDVVVFDDVRSARLLLALEHHDRTELGHSCGVPCFRTPLLLDQFLGRRDRAGGLSRQDQTLHRPARKVDAQVARFLRHPQRVGRGRAHHGCVHVHDLIRRAPRWSCSHPAARGTPSSRTRSARPRNRRTSRSENAKNTMSDGRMPNPQKP